jgi:hypothetical protein
MERVLAEIKSFLAEVREVVEFECKLAIAPALRTRAREGTYVT